MDEALEGFIAKMFKESPEVINDFVAHGQGIMRIKIGRDGELKTEHIPIESVIHEFKNEEDYAIQAELPLSE